MKQKQNAIPHVVVIGGGFAGIDLIKKLQRHRVRITLIDRNNHFTFTCLLYQVATAGLGADAIAYPFRKLFAGHRRVHFMMASVLEIDPKNQVVFTNAGSVSYDYLVIATGTSTNFYGNESLQQSCYELKTIPQAIQIRNSILLELETATAQPVSSDTALNFFIVGAGPTGVELAGALAEIKAKVLPGDYPDLDPERMRIHLVEANDRVLAALSPVSSSKAQKYLEDLGVVVHLKTSVKAYDGKNLFLNTGKTIPAVPVIWSAGVKGNILPGLDAAELQKSNRYQVDEYLRVKPYKNIFAIGDIAYVTTDPSYPNGHPMVAQVAKQEGKIAAINIISVIDGHALYPFRYKDLGSMATIGRHKAVMEVFGVKMQGFFAWVGWMFLHLITLVGFRNKLVVLLNWVWNYVTYKNAIRIIVNALAEKRVKEHDKIRARA